ARGDRAYRRRRVLRPHRRRLVPLRARSARAPTPALPADHGRARGGRGGRRLVARRRYASAASASDRSASDRTAADRAASAVGAAPAALTAPPAFVPAPTPSRSPAAASPRAVA